MKKIHKNVLGKNQKLDQDKERMHDERIAQAIAEACFLDDVFGRTLLENCSDEERNAIAKGILEPILNVSGLEIVDSMAQKDMQELYSHSAKMDFWARDKEGQAYDIEFQMHPPLSFARLETYAAVLIKQGIRPGEDYTKLRDAWVIFITSERHWSDTGEEIFKDKPVRRFELAEVLDNNQLKLVENSHYHLFVANALYDKDDPLGDLMRDLSTNQAAEVKMPALHESEKRFKEGKDYKIMFSTYTELVKEERAEMKKAQEEAKKAQAEMEKARQEAKKAQAEAKELQAKVKELQDKVKELQI